MNLAFAVVWNKNERTKLTNELVSIDRQSNVCRTTKCMQLLQSFSELHGRLTQKLLSSVKCSFQANKHTYFLSIY